jgi:hypothetical protein
MAVRDFVDANGVNWKVWPVTPESLQPRTAAEDYLGDYGEGWLCFESQVERRRLARYPTDWDALNDEQLCSLLEAAAIVPARRPKYPTPPPNEPRRP